MGRINLNYSVKTRNELSKNRQLEIEKFYTDTAKKLAKIAKKMPKDEYIEAYLRSIEKDLNSEISKFNKQLRIDIKNDMLNTADSVVSDNQDWIAKTGLTIKGAYTHIPTETVESILTGQIYESNWSLSKALWKDTKKFSKDINKVIAEGVALNKSTYDIAKNLEMYVNPNAVKPWDWGKVYPGVKTKVDYNAQRLARTMVQHAYQQTLENALKPNPFNKGIRWRSALIANRTCELCRERNGKIYKKGQLPIDHPNGLCTFIPVMDNLEDVATELADWVNGKSNKSIDEWVNSMKK